jgi:hypothetical protein
MSLRQWMYVVRMHVDILMIDEVERVRTVDSRADRADHECLPVQKIDRPPTRSRSRGAGRSAGFGGVGGKWVSRGEPRLTLSHYIKHRRAPAPLHEDFPSNVVSLHGKHLCCFPLGSRPDSARN